MNRPHRFRRTMVSPASQAGFTLVELMIAVTVSLVMMTSLVALLVNVNSNNSEMERVNNQIENGRFAIQILRDDIMQAGFWGPHTPLFEDREATGAATDIPAAVPDPCLTPSDWSEAHKVALTGIPIQGSTAAPGTCGSVVTSQKADTDVLVVRRADSCVPGEANCDAFTDGKLYFQASLCPTELAAGTRFRIDSVAANLNLLTGACAGTLAPLRKFISNMYWIRDFATTPGDGIPTLVRSQLDLASGALAQQPAVALIEGIDGFNVEFGVDDTVTRCSLNSAVDYTQAPTLIDPASCAVNTEASRNTLPTRRGDGTPDGNFVRCTAGTPCTVAQLMNTVAVKLYVLARSREVTAGYTDTKTYSLGTVTRGPFNDGFKRHVFSTTVRLINVSGRRETP